MESTMKFILFLGDGMSDLPVAELDGKTPLMVADTPNMDRMVREGVGGWSRNTPDGFYPGSDIANLGVLGYDVRESYTGRSPLEAAAMGVTLGPSDMAFRCNLVSLSDDFGIMEDFSAAHIPTDQATHLISYLNQQLGSDLFQFYPGVSYRHLLVWRDYRAHSKASLPMPDHEAIRCVAPHDISDQSIGGHLPSGVDAGPIERLVRASWKVLSDHPINHARRKGGERPANSIWLWGHGKKPTLTSFKKRFGLSGGMISAVDLMRGIAANIGFETLHVPGATGWIDTDYEGKAQACLEGLTRHDVMFVHVESPDEAGHAGRLDYKIQAIEDFDKRLVGPVLDAMASRGGAFRAIALPDHPTPVATKTHNADPVPFALYGSGVRTDDNTVYDERLLQSGSLHFDPGIKMMRALLSTGGIIG